MVAVAAETADPLTTLSGTRGRGTTGKCTGDSRGKADWTGLSSPRPFVTWSCEILSFSFFAWTVRAKMSGSQVMEDEEMDLVVPEVPPPSVRPDEACVHSFSYYSTDAPSGTDAPSAKGKQKATNNNVQVDGNWMLGVDEAGRGPVLGTWRDASDLV